MRKLSLHIIQAVKITLLFMMIFTNFAIADSDWLAHKILVPEDFANGRSTEFFEGTSDIERYIKNYEKTWWKVMRAFVTGNQDWKSHEAFSICSGTPAAADACIHGYESAFNRLESLIKLYGEMKVKTYIQDRITPATTDIK